jgi:hypothetical protein
VASCRMETASFGVPGDSIRLESNDGRVLSLAEKLWVRSVGETPAGGAMILGVAVRPGGGAGAVPDRQLAWELGEREYVASIPGLLVMRIALASARVEAEVTSGLLEADPSFVARTLLEAPVAVLLCRRGYTVLHAGAVVGRRGAVVLRGAGGAGKSTLVAAAWRAGLGVLADESLLVSRGDDGLLVASVRELTLLPDAERLLGLESATEEAFAGGETKRRIDLFEGSAPNRRVARRAATLLLGPRAPGPARLVTLGEGEFLAAFREGEIPQERQGGNPDAVAESWAGRDSWRLDGAVDLAGAVALLESLSG